MSYGAKLPDMYRRAATYDRVMLDLRDRPPGRLLRKCVVLLVTLVSVALLAGGLIDAWGPATTSAQEIEVDLVGFLVLAAGERLPPSGEAPARLEVPNDQGGARLIFPVEFTRRTEMALPEGTARSGQLVRVEGVIHQGECGSSVFGTCKRSSTPPACRSRTGRSPSPWPMTGSSRSSWRAPRPSPSPSC